MTLPKARNDDELEKLTEELMVQLVEKFMQVKNDLVRQDGDPSSWAWFYDERPYPRPALLFKTLDSVLWKSATLFTSSPWPSFWN
jgi:hypothetical protein